MRRPAWCSSCGKAFQAKSRKQRECPGCSMGPEPDESSGDLEAVSPIVDAPLMNSLAPGVDPAGPPPSVIIDFPGTPGSLAADERECPRCAETIKAKALACRFCGLDFDIERRGREAHEAERLFRASPEGKIAEKAERMRRLETSSRIEIPSRRTARDPATDGGDAWLVIKGLGLAFLVLIVLYAAIQEARERQMIHEFARGLADLGRDR